LKICQSAQTLLEVVYDYVFGWVWQNNWFYHQITGFQPPQNVYEYSPHKMFMNTNSGGGA
jgi:hypothetical protein